MNPPLKPEQWRSIQVQFEGQRLRRGWTREELARKAGVSRTTLFYLERGGTQHPRLSTLKRLAETLDLDFHRLMDESLATVGEPSPQNFVDPWSPSFDQVADSDQLTVSGPFGNSQRFDRETNPFVAQVVSETPALFQGFTESDWNELYSCMGMGGALTPHGVRDQAARIARKKQLVRKLEVLLETHYSEVAAALLETLFRQIQISSPVAQSDPGWQAPLRQRPPGQK